MSEIKDKIKAWQKKIIELTETYSLGSRELEYLLKKNFDELDWRTLLTDEMFDVVTEELKKRQVRGVSKYEKQIKYLSSDKGKKKALEATRRYRKNAKRKSDN